MKCIRLGFLKNQCILLFFAFAIMILNDEFGFWCIKLCLLIMFSKAIACSELQCHLLLPFSCPPYNGAFPKKSCNALSSCLFASSKHLQSVMRNNAMHAYVTSSCTLHDGNTFVLFSILIKFRFNESSLFKLSSLIRVGQTGTFFVHLLAVVDKKSDIWKTPKIIFCNIRTFTRNLNCTNRWAYKTLMRGINYFLSTKDQHIKRQSIYRKLLQSIKSWNT